MIKKMLAITICVFILLGLSACVRKQELDPSKIDSNLFEFPGLTWNCTPKEVRDVLKLQDEQIVLDEQTATAQDKADFDTWTMLVTDLTFAGREVHSAKFVFVRYSECDFGLSNVTLFFSDETNMYELRDELCKQFGDGKDGFEGYRITDNNTLEQTMARKDPKQELPRYWFCDAKFNNTLPNDLKAAVINHFAGLYPYASQETIEEYLNHMLLASLSVSNHNMTVDSNEKSGENTPYTTHNQIFFSGDLFVNWTQKFGK